MKIETDEALNDRLTVALEAANIAGDLLRTFSADLAVQRKGDRDLVTAADLAAQSAIIDRLRKAFPGDAIIAEEGTWKQPDGGYWVIDPLDGTVNYSRGLPLYGVSIAFADASGSPQIGVINLPEFDEVYWATAGGGAFLNGSFISVSRTDDLEKALVNISDFNTGPDEKRRDYNRRKVGAIGTVHEHCMRVKNLSSAAVELAWVAAGRLDAYLMVFCHYWDSAAGALLVEEAGGLVSDLQGRDFGADSTIVLASTAPLHRRLNDLLGPVVA